MIDPIDVVLKLPFNSASREWIINLLAKTGVLSYLAKLLRSYLWYDTDEGL